METKKTILERIEAVNAWVEPQRVAYFSQRANDRKIGLYYGITLNYVLQSAAYSLGRFFEQMAIDPLATIKNTTDFERIAMVDFLLPSMENWMNGKKTGDELATQTYEYCKNRIMSGYLADMNCTNPVVNFLSVCDYKNYCELVKTINKAALQFHKEKDNELEKEKELAARTLTKEEAQKVLKSRKA